MSSSCGVTELLLLCSFLFPFPLSRYKHYERWATANDFPVENVVNDGSTRLEDRLGAVADLELVIRSRALRDDVMVVRVASRVSGRRLGMLQLYTGNFLC